MNEEFEIGFKFFHQRGWWKIVTNGAGGCYGAVSLKTNAFTTFEHDEVIGILKNEPQPNYENQIFIDDNS